MSERSDAEVEPRLHWNRGGWLGSQLGGSLWMLVAGLLAVPKDAASASIVLVLFAAVNALGLLLWRRRAELPVLAAFLILLGAIGAAGCAAIFTLDRAGVWESIQLGSRISARASYIVLAAVPLGLALLLSLRFGRAEESDELPRG
jgi:hypothetical protein